VLLFRWRRIDGVLRRVIAAEVTQPTASVDPATLAQWRLQFANKGGQDAIPLH
jgi:hypothetical protein